MNPCTSSRFSCNLWETSHNRTPSELPGSIRTRMISKFLCWKMMTKGSLSRGLILEASSLEKTMLISVVLAVLIENSEDMIFTEITYLAYLRRANLERPLSKIPPIMVLIA